MNYLKPKDKGSPTKVLTTNLRNLYSTERIVYMNELLNGSHGDKLRNVAEFVMSKRMDVYQNLKNTSTDEMLVEKLETKVDEYVESKNKKCYYGKKYSTIERSKNTLSSKVKIEENKNEKNKELNFRGVLKKIKKIREIPI